MKRRAPREKLSVKRIIGDKDNWSRYKEAYADEVTKDQQKEVEKMLKCGDPSQGFATYICLGCGEQVSVPFSCKSRVCSSCGKVHADEWSKKLVGRMYNVSHRHITFTVPSELWSVLEKHPEWRKELFVGANETIREVMRSEPGAIMVLHPYGKDMKANYHLHVLMTEGGMNEKGEWEKQEYVSYKALRKVWQYQVLSQLRKKMKEAGEEDGLIDRMFRQYENGFYVHAEPRVKDGSGLSRYIGRYIRHPAIADSRIVKYDGQTVSFVYRERGGKKQEVTLPVLEFIHGVVRHIPPKHFKMVRYYGIYAPRKANKVRELMKAIGQVVGRAIRRLGWRERIWRDFKRDPLQCPKCGQAGMVLYSLTILVKGRLRTIGGLSWLIKRGDVVEPPQPSLSAGDTSRPIQLTLGF